MPPSSQAAYQSLQDYDKTRVNPQSAIDQGEQRYGVSGLGSQLASLRAMTGNLETSIKNVGPSVTGRTQGSLVTEAARQRIVNQERSPLIDQYGTASKGLADTGAQYDKATGLATNYANELLANDKNTYDRLFGQYQTSLSAEQAAAAQAEKQREFDASLAEQKASRAAAAGGSGGLSLASLFGGAQAAAPTAQQPTVQDHLSADIQKLLPKDYATRLPEGYTERLIQRLQAVPQYAGIRDQIPQMVYAYRKPFEPAPAAPSRSATDSSAYRTVAAMAGR